MNAAAPTGALLAFDGEAVANVARSTLGREGHVFVERERRDGICTLEHDADGDSLGEGGIPLQEGDGGGGFFVLT